MATRNYTKSGPINANQLAGDINTGMGWTGTTVQVGVQPSLVIVDNPLLTAANDAAINTILTSYSFDRLFDERGVTRQQINAAVDSTSLILRAIVAVLVDEINILRAAASLPPRTLAQAATAIMTKITNKGAD